MSAFNVPLGHAGEWQIVPAFDSAEEAARYQGTFSLYPYGEDQGTEVHPFIDHLRIDDQGGATPGDVEIVAESYENGGAAGVTMDGTLHSILQWNPSMITNAAGELVPDPEDTPPPFVYLRIEAQAYADATDVYAVDPEEGYVRQPQKEHATATLSIVGLSDPVTATTQVNTDGTLAQALMNQIIKVPSNGQIILTTPVATVHADGHLGSSRFTIPMVNGVSQQPLQNPGQARAGARYKATLMPYHLSISSDIEPSWKKLTGELPDKYKKRINVNGVWEWQPDPDKAQVVSADPQIWRVKCRRGADGSMTVERAATWREQNDPEDSAGNWYGSALRVSANSQGFNNPQFQWQVSGGTPGPSLQEQIDQGEQTLKLYHIWDGFWRNVGLNLGGFVPSPESNYGDLGFTRQSTFDVTAKEATIPGISLTSKYTINWHPPIDNVEEYKNSIDSYTAFPAAVVGGYPESTNIPDENIRVVVDPSGWRFLHLQSDGQRMAVGTVGFAAGVAVAYFSGGAFPVTMSLMTRATGAGTWAGIQAGYAQTQQESCVNSLAEWQSAVADTQSAINGSSMHDIRVSPSSLALSNSDLRQQFQMTPWIVRPYTARFYKGDGYDRHGYTGIDYGHYEYPQEPKVVGYYELATSPSNE